MLRWCYYTPQYHNLLCILLFHLLAYFNMAPKPESAAGKAPASTASKTPPIKDAAGKGVKNAKEHVVPVDGEKKTKEGQKRTPVIFAMVSSYVSWCPIIPIILLLVHKQVHPDKGIPKKAMAMLNSFVNDIIHSDSHRWLQNLDHTVSFLNIIVFMILKSK